jgi:undecaprenyl-diphosphatase
MEILRNLDITIFDALHSLVGRAAFWDVVLKIVAVYLIYLIPIILIIVWFWAGNRSKEIALTATFSGLFAWFGVCYTIGAFYFRARPFVGYVGSQMGTQELVFHRPDRSFPSDHSAFLFALAFSFWFCGYKKLGWLIFLIAIIISFARVATGLHWPSDVGAGLLIGFFVASIFWLLRKPMGKYIYNPIINFANKFKL